MKCEFCQKEIVTIYDEAELLNSASFIEIHEDKPIIYSGFGSCHDGDIAYFTDRELATELKQKLQTEKYLYICDECYEKIKDKISIFESIGLPWIFPNVPQEHFYESIPRTIVALTYEQLFNLPDDNVYKLKISKTHPTDVKSLMSNDRTKVDFDEVLIINADDTFEVMDQTLFKKLFIPKV